MMQHQEYCVLIYLLYDMLWLTTMAIIRYFVGSVKKNFGEVNKGRRNSGI